MLTLEYLQTVLEGEFESFDTEKQVIESAAGYDGIVALVQTKGISPMVVLENSEVGEFRMLEGGFSKTTQSIWVMKMVGRDGDRHAVQQECFGMMKRIISIFIRREKEPPLAQWVWSDRVPWGVRNAGPNFTGYEFTLSFDEDIDLTYEENH